PSPLRNLELLFDQMIAAGMQQEVDQEISDAVQRAADRETTRQASRFLAKPTSRAEAAARQFKAMAQVKTKAAPASKTEGTELRKIKRSRKGMRG
ncbi:MAG: hypothetical protein HY465_03595, partial [Deltaproteobacteria bacterium]|nr:hypothetical protein [Deltaproteobacteria bacterium]